MKNVKKKLTTMLFGVGLLFVANGMINPSYADLKFEQFKKDGFNITIGHPSTSEKEYFYSVEVWSENNKENAKGFGYDGDTDFYFIYSPSSFKCKGNVCNFDAFDKNRDGWVRRVNKWKRVADNVTRSNKDTGSYFSDVSYENVPGSPKVSQDMSFRLRVDFDENEEYAAATFANEKDALEWADNMIRIFKSKDYELYNQ